MTTPIRIGLSLALAAFALSLALPARAQSWMPEGPIDTPNFIESWNGGPKAAPPAEKPQPQDDAPVRIKSQRANPEAPAESVVVHTGYTDEEEPQPKPRRLPAVIDQYPQNPKCYVAGRYVPAPPVCPN